MFITNELESQIMREIDSISALNKIKSINLGGIAGVSGGQGAPPGGFTGQLAQKYVTFDTQELISSGIGATPSLVENLNRIRGGWSLGDGSITSRHLASGISIPTITTITVEDEDTSLPNINTIIFTNSNGVTLTSPNEATVAIPTITTTNNIYSIPSGVGTRFSTYSWYIDGYLASGVSTEDIYKFIDPYILYGVTLTTQNPGSIDSKFNIQSSLTGSTWTNLFTPDFSIESGIYSKHYSFNQVTLESGILLRNIITTAGNLNGITITLEGITNIIAISSGGSGVLGNLSPNKVVITTVDGIATTSENLNYDEDLIINEVSVTRAPTIKFNRTYGSGIAPISEVTIGSLNAGAFNGTEIVESKGNIRIVTSEDWNTTNNGTSIIMDTTPIGSTTPQESLVLTDGGDLSIAGDFFAGEALITKLFVGNNNINASLSGLLHKLSVVGDDTDPSHNAIQLLSFSDTKYPFIAQFHARGSRLSPTPTQTDDVIGRWTGRGYYGGPNNDYAPQSRARMDFLSEDDYTDTNQGSRIEFYTTASGTSNTIKNLEIGNDGVVEVNRFRLTTNPVVGQALICITSEGEVGFQEISSGHTIQSSGIPYTARTNLNFAGAVQILDDPLNDATVITVTAADNQIDYVVGTSTASLTVEIVRPELKNYNPDSIPSIPSSFDDEFDDDSLSAQWTVTSTDTAFDLRQSDGTQHISESIHHGYVTFQGNWDYTGLNFYQAFAPAEDDWTLVTKILPGYTFQDDCMTDFGVYGVGNTNYYQIRLGTANGGVTGVRVLYNDGGGDAEAINFAYPIANGVYVLMTKREDVGWGYALYSTFVSSNGINWIPVDLERQMTTLMTADLTTQYFGLNGGFANPIAAIDFIRYFPQSMVFDIGSNV